MFHEKKLKPIRCQKCKFEPLILKAGPAYTLNDDMIEIRLGIVCPRCKFDGVMVVTDNFDDKKKSKINYIG